MGNDWDPIRVELFLRRDTDSIQGRCRTAGRSCEFSGWLELASALERLRFSGKPLGKGPAIESERREQR